MRQRNYILALLTFFTSFVVNAAGSRISGAQTAPGLNVTGNYFVNPICLKNDYNVTDADSIASCVSSGGLSGAGTSWRIDADASGEKAVWTWTTYPEKLEGGNCVVGGTYTGDFEDYEVNVIQNSVTLVTANADGTDFPTVSGKQPFEVSFICGSDNSNLVTVEVEATDAGAGQLDLIWEQGGENTNIGSAAQATLVGRSYFATTASCLWTRSNTAIGDFGTTSACPGPTIESQTLGQWQTTDSDLPRQTINNLPAGEYEVLVSVPFYGNTTGGQLNYVVSDGTTTSGNTYAQPWTTNGGGGITLVAKFTYTDAGNRSFTLQCSAGTGTCNIDNASNSNRVTFQIKRFASEQVAKVGFPGQEWTAYTPGSTWSTNTTVTGKYQCLAGNLLVQAKAAVSGAPDSASLRFDLPTNFTIDTSDLTDSTNSNILMSQVGILDSGTALKSGAVRLVNSDTNTVEIVYSIETGASVGWSAVNQAAPFTFASGDFVNAWFMVPVTASSPCHRTSTGLFKNAVTTSSAGVEGVERAIVTSTCSASPCTIARQSGGFTSITRSATGTYTANFVSGTFSAGPSCVVMSNTGETTILAYPTSSSFQFLTATNAGLGQDAGFSIICVGPR